MGGALGGAAAMALLGPRYVLQDGRRVNKPLVPLFKNNSQVALEDN